jgi:hypothetical protein
MSIRSTLETVLGLMLVCSQIFGCVTYKVLNRVSGRQPSWMPTFELRATTETVDWRVSIGDPSGGSLDIEVLQRQLPECRDLRFFHLPRRLRGTDEEWREVSSDFTATQPSSGRRAQLARRRKLEGRRACDLVIEVVKESTTPDYPFVLPSYMQRQQPWGVVRAIDWHDQALDQARIEPIQRRWLWILLPFTVVVDAVTFPFQWIFKKVFAF